MQALAPLDYAPAPGKARRIARRVILALLVLGVTSAGYVAVNAALPRWRFQTRQRHLVKWGFAEPVVVYEEDAVEKSRLCAADSHYRLVPDHNWCNMPRSSPRVLPVGRFDPAGAPFDDPIAYAHEVKTASNRYLLTVEFSMTESGQNRTLWLRPDVSTIVGFSGRSSIVARGHGLQWQLGVGDHFRMFAGHPNPSDPARFAIPYVLNGGSGLIVGVVRDDGQVELTPTDPGARWSSD
jgi:hypothetical protein